MTISGQRLGSVNVTAKYQGDLNNAPSVSKNFTLDVVYIPPNMQWKGTVSINTLYTFNECTTGNGVTACADGYAKETWTGTFSVEESSACENAGSSICGNATGSGTEYEYDVLTGATCEGSAAIPSRLGVFSEPVSPFGNPPPGLYFGFAVGGPHYTALIPPSAAFTGAMIPCTGSEGTSNVGMSNLDGAPVPGVPGATLQDGVPEVHTFSRSYNYSSLYGSCPADSCSGTFVFTTTTVITVEPYMNVYCHPADQVAGGVVDCRAYVFGINPTGTVSWGAHVVASNTTVPFNDATCDLLPVTSTASACQIWLRSDAYGSVKVAAAYSGDANNPAVESHTSVSFVQGRSEVAVTCSPSVVNGTLQADCKAVVSGTPPTPIPTGTIVWNETSPTGTFSNSTCSLVDGSCGVTFNQGNSSIPATIVSTYLGDSIHPSAQAATSLTMVEGSAAYADQNLTTGLNVKLSSVTGVVANVTTAYLTSQPGGTGTPPFATNEYFDVDVGGVTGGSATVCYFGAEVNATTSMAYYYNGAWDAASNVVATAGVSVCGTIPVAALTGTPLAVGGPNTTAVTTTASSSQSVATASAAQSTSTTSSSSAAQTSSTLSSQSTSKNGGIPEFPFQSLLVPTLTVLVVVSYLIVRRAGGPGAKDARRSNAEIAPSKGA